MCSPGSRSHYTGQFNWQLFSVTIEIDLAGHAWCSVCRFSIAVTVQWTTASIARSCSDPSEPGACEGSSIRSPNFVLPICLHVSVATGGMLSTAMCMSL
jgi:hypothetical protein